METSDPPAFFGDWLKQRRKSFDLTQEELAQRAGCSVFALRKIEAGERRPSKQLAGWIARALEIPTEDQGTFIRVARGELSLERLPFPLTPSDSVQGASGSFALSQLPVYFTALVGRETELDALAKIFNAPECRLLTLTGLGGMGKTRLAVEFAGTQFSNFPAGVFYVALAALNAPDLIVPAIADALQFSFSGPSDLKDQLIGHIARHLGRPALFVLDNMEHLLPTGSHTAGNIDPADLIAEMLQRLPMVKFLVTSRERLNLKGEWTYELYGLPAPPTILVDRLDEYSAAVLFLQNAGRIKGDFSLGEGERPALARICQLLEGIPLAIELAASWVGMLSCQEIAAEIEANIDFLSTSMRDIPERHRSLRATFNHSWKLLGPDERRILSQLSVFRGGFSREAAAEIAAASLALLASLVSKSLVHRVEEGRYDLHEVIRQFALSYLLDDPHYPGVRDRHSAYYLSYISQREWALKSALQQETLRELVLEMDNARVAWAWAIELENYAAIGQAVRGFSWFFETAGLLSEGIEHFERLVASLGTKDRTPLRERMLGLVLSQQSLLIFRKGQFDRARRRWEDSLALLRPLGEPALLSDPLVFLGIICHLDGELDRSQALMEEGLTCAQAAGDEWFQAYAIYNLGYLDSLRGHHEQGYETMQAGLAIWRRIGDPHSITLGLNFLGTTLIELGRFDEAEACLEESIALSERSRNRWGSGTAYRYLGLTKLMQNEFKEAETLIRKSLEVFSGYTEGWDIALSRIYLGRAVLAAGNFPEARENYLEALRIARAAKSVPLILEALVALAEIHAEEGACFTAARLAQFVHDHEISSMKNKTTAGRLISQLEKCLPAGDFQALRNTGQNHSLESIVEMLN